MLYYDVFPSAVLARFSMDQSSSQSIVFSSHDVICTNILYTGNLLLRTYEIVITLITSASYVISYVIVASKTRISNIDQHIFVSQCVCFTCLWFLMCTYFPLTKNRHKKVHTVNRVLVKQSHYETFLFVLCA